MLYDHSAAVIAAIGLAAAWVLGAVPALLLPLPATARVGALLLAGLPALCGLLARLPGLALVGAVAAMLVFAVDLVLMPGPLSAGGLAAAFVLGAATLALLQACWFRARAGEAEPAVGWAALAQLAGTLALSAVVGVALVAGAAALAPFGMSALLRPLVLLAGVLAALAAAVLGLSTGGRS